jgi:hypothetical protein
LCDGDVAPLIAGPENMEDVAAYDQFRIAAACIDCQCAGPCTGDQGCTFDNRIARLFVILQGSVFSVRGGGVTRIFQIGEKQPIN